MSNVVLLVVELLFLAAAHCFGGPPWTVIGAIAVVAQTLGGIRIESLALMVPSLAWLGLSYATGNRELFFPYTMYLASCLAVMAPRRPAWLGPLGGAGIVAAFMVIRILQQATFRVLAVELVVAAVILALVILALVILAPVILARSWGRHYAVHVAPVAWHAAIIAAASLLAYASLAI